MTWQTFALALLWAGAIAFLGWSLARWLDRLQMRREKRLRDSTNVAPFALDHDWKMRRGGR